MSCLIEYGRIVTVFYHTDLEDKGTYGEFMGPGTCKEQGMVGEEFGFALAEHEIGGKRYNTKWQGSITLKLSISTTSSFRFLSLASEQT